MINKKNNWRSGLDCENIYKKKFALFPVVCHDGTKVWLRYYYKKYEIWRDRTRKTLFDTEFPHIDYIESITESEYIVRKIIEGF